MGIPLHRHLLRLATAALAVLALPAMHAAPPARAPVTLRVATAFDPQTLDPHSVTLLHHTRVVSNLYEGLVGRDEQYRLEPALALRWEQRDATTWRFHLRPGVRFHQGEPFSADDVVFSIGRALAPPAQRAYALQGLRSARKIDPLTVDLLLSAPDALLPDKLHLVAMMSASWCRAHGATLAQDAMRHQDSWTVLHANGTGPFRLDRYEPEQQTRMLAFGGWWGRADPRNGNVERLVFQTLPTDATRVSALESGEIDLLIDPPFQDVERLQRDPRLTLTQLPDLGLQLLAFNQGDATLPGPGNGAPLPNLLRDRRVRTALYQAINIDLIVQKILRGQASPTGSLLPPSADGHLPEFDGRLRFDPVRARALLAEAGWPAGLTLPLDCLNSSQRQQVCEAMAGMLAQVGVRVQVRYLPMSQLLDRVTEGGAGLIEHGWSAAPDAWASLDGLLHSPGPGGHGRFNAGHYANPALDRLIDDLRSEPDIARRRRLVSDATRLSRDDIAVLPLYRRHLSWAMQRRVQVRMWPDDVLPARWVVVDGAAGAAGTGAAAPPGPRS